MSLAERFWAQLAVTPDAVAVYTPEPVTYAELGRHVAALAAALGDRRGDRVGLLLDHGLPMITGILGALTAGAVYVPLDPSYPDSRLAHMAADAEASVVVTAAAPAWAASVVPLPEASGPAESTPIPVDPDEPAYILYTSGSTGVPKGVVQTHRNALFQVDTHIRNQKICPDDRVGVVTSFAFDMAVTDMFSALLSGAAAVPVDVRAAGISGLADAVRDTGITVYHSTPTVFRYLTDGSLALPSLRVVLLGGEKVLGGDLARMRRYCSPDCVLINGYGLTEVSFIAQWPVRVGDTAPGTDPAVLPVGRPLDGITVELASGGGAAGSGEIVVTTPYLASYWRDPRRNAERFTVEPDGTRGYRTGDLGRWLPDGRLEYLGRLDRQVKVRGNRVELGEVEAVLSAQPGVTQAVLVGRETVGPAGPETALVGYTLGTADPSALRAAVAARLPDFAVPSAIVALPDFPLTSTGKVDTAALPDPVAPTAAPGAGPRTATERFVADLWQNLLGRTGIDVHDTFFDIGGHSLLLARFRDRLADALGRRVPLTALYAHPTVAALSAHLDAGPDPTAPGDIPARMARRRAARDRRA